VMEEFVGNLVLSIHINIVIEEFFLVDWTERLLHIKIVIIILI